MKKLIMLLTGLIVLCLYAQNLQAQTRPGSLRGTITDAKSGETVPFANVVLKDQKGNVVSGGASDIEGRYNISPIAPGTYTVMVSFTGYSTITLKNLQISPNTPTVQDFKLSPATEELQEVVIMYRRPLIDRFSSGRTITPNDYHNSSQRSSMPKQPQSIISQAAGATQDANGSINVRGARSEGTVYYIDGVKILGNTNAPSPTIRPTNNESYSSIAELPFKAVTSTPLSTFSSDVDAASYANVRRFITDGQLPPEDAVRIEEMINYFEYSYPNPDEGEIFSMTTEIGVCPWRKEHQLLRVGIKTKKLPQDDLPDNNLVFLIDVSGSMGSYAKLPLLQKSLRLLVKGLSDKDRVAIVVYASASGLVLSSTKGSDKRKILEAIDNLSAGGSTAGGAGINLAYTVAMENFKKNEYNRVILATDGDFNVGVSSEEGLVKLIEEKRDEGISLTVLGFGTGNLQDSKMEKLADHGNGNYAYIDNLMEAQKVLVNEMGATLHTVAKDTKFQIEFNPMQVKAYRLIGYENRMLEDEDFNDDTKDAGDVGSGHSVTAVYEIIPANSAETLPSPPVDPLKYQRKVGLTNEGIADELATLKIRYKAPDRDVSVLRTKVVAVAGEEAEPSQDFLFVCAVMETGMLLRQSEYAGNSSFDEALQLAKAGKSEDENGYRGEFIRLVSLAEKLDRRQNVGMR